MSNGQASKICGHLMCCDYYLCAHPQCCGYHGREYMDIRPKPRDMD